MLTKKQYAALGVAAYKAFAASVPESEKNEIAFIIKQQGGRASASAVFDFWRRREISVFFADVFARRKVEPPQSFSALTQNDYAHAMEHFAAIAGDDSAAIEYRRRAAEQGCARVLALIEASCRSRNLAFPDYPDRICIDQYRCLTGFATEKQLWTILFTVRNRRSCAKKNEADCRTSQRFYPRPNHG